MLAFAAELCVLGSGRHFCHTGSRAYMEGKEGREGKEERAHLPLQVSPGVQVHPFIDLWAFKSISPHPPNPLCLINSRPWVLLEWSLNQQLPAKAASPSWRDWDDFLWRMQAPLSSVSSLGEAASPSIPDIVMCHRERAESQRVDPGSSHTLLHVWVALAMA